MQAVVDARNRARSPHEETTLIVAGVEAVFAKSESHRFRQDEVDELTIENRALRDRVDYLVGRERELVAKLDSFRRVKHLKRGTFYKVLGELEFQLAKPDHDVLQQWPYSRIFEGTKITVYQAEDGGKLYGRFPDEFEDGRFGTIAEAAEAIGPAGTVAQEPVAAHNKSTWWRTEIKGVPAYTSSYFNKERWEAEGKTVTRVTDEDRSALVYASPQPAAVQEPVAEPDADAMRVIDPDQWEPCSPAYLSAGGSCSAPRVWNAKERNHWHPKLLASIPGEPNKE
jgi:hypothetical protein